MQEIFLLALVVSLASGLAIILRKLSVPMLVSYLLAGAVLSGFHLVKPEQLEFLSFLPEIGLAFLLFLVGMELDLREFRSLGKNVLIAVLGQTILTGILLYLFWGSWLLALVLSFSSTILVVKLLLEQRELSSLHGKLAVGILLIEDLLAILVLMFMSPSGASGAWIFVKGVFLIWAAVFAGKRLLPGLFRLTADNLELLFLTGIGWCLIFVSVSLWLGFSLGVGAFLAGVSLAQSVYRTQISSRIKPLRDFFIMVFFIDLGTGLSISGLSGSWGLALAILGYTLVAKPIIFFVTLAFLRFRVHTAFQAAILLSSVSEFALIVLAMATRQGVMAREFFAPVIFAAVVSFILSSFLVTHKSLVYRFLRRYLKKIERSGAVGIGFFPGEKVDFDRHAVLLGCHRSGSVILPVLQKIYGNNLIVVDFSPEVVEELKNNFVPCLYGDVADPEIAEMLNLKGARLVVSTIRDLGDNLGLLSDLEKAQSKAVTIISASDMKEAITLYERGAGYVSMPLTLEGENIGRMITEHKESLQDLVKERERRLGELKRIQSNSVTQ